MDDTGVVRAREPLGDLDSDVDRFLDFQRAAVDPFLERLAGVVGHRQEHLAVRRLVDLMDSADVRVVERRGRLRLLHQALLGFGITRALGRQKLEGNHPLEPKVLGFVNDPHATAAELLDNAIVGNRSSFHGHHPGVLRL